MFLLPIVCIIRYISQGWVENSIPIVTVPTKETMLYSTFLFGLLECSDVGKGFLLHVGGQAVPAENSETSQLDFLHEFNPATPFLSFNNLQPLNLRPLSSWAPSSRLTPSPPFSSFVSSIDPQLVLHLARAVPAPASAFALPPTSHLPPVASTPARRRNPIKWLPRKPKFKKRSFSAVLETI